MNDSTQMLDVVWVRKKKVLLVNIKKTKEFLRSLRKEDKKLDKALIEGRVFR